MASNAEITRDTGAYKDAKAIFKLVLVGDGGTGKVSLCASVCSGSIELTSMYTDDFCQATSDGRV